MSMQTGTLAMLAMLAVAASGAAHAQIRYSNEEIVAAISNCMVENAPKEWQVLIFTLDQPPAVSVRQSPAVVAHQVIVGIESNPPQDLKPCRAEYVQKAVNTFRENQDEKERSWTGITFMVYRDGRFSITYRYPK